jgi:hypothetical protein
MRNSTLCLSIQFVVLLAATSAFAQRAPSPGMLAVGGSVGAAAPSDAGLANGLEAAVNVEGYLTARVSARAQLGGSSWEVTGRHFTGKVKPVRLDGNLVYNWEGGAWHPYVTAGIGMYHYKSKFDPGIEGSDTKAGFNLGGGLEYFFAQRATITAEALYHHTGTFDTPLAVFDGPYWSIGVGLKAYIKR